MHFIVIGKDGTDEDAIKRRKGAREQHLNLGNEMLGNKQLLNAAALINEDGDMCGSVMLVDFETRYDLDLWLENEPYVKFNVWHTVEVFQAAVGPDFKKYLPK